MYDEKNVILLIPDVSEAQLDVNSNSILISIFFCVSEIFLKYFSKLMYGISDENKMPWHSQHIRANQVVQQFKHLWSNVMCLCFQIS